MSYKVRIDSFEGPFDLLLYLVSRQKVDIGAISITEIADQYLAEVSRMETLDLDVASDFLLVASTLLEIKAQSLIPRERDELDDDLAELAPSEARDMLVERLMEYKKFKNAAAVLHNRFIAEGRMHTRPFGPDADFLGLMPDFLEGVSLDALAYQAGCCALGEGGLFVGETQAGPVCLCAEGDGHGLLLCKELLGGPAVRQVLPHLPGMFPGRRLVVRTPAAPGQKEGTLEFAMLKWLAPALEDRWNWEDTGYLGLAFD